jgi:sec-independent protein translocase protein TatB
VFGISMWEVVLILVVALVVLGPRQLTEVAKAAGRIYKELQRMAWDVRNSIDLNSIDTSPPPPSPPRYEPLLPKSDSPAPELSPKEMPPSNERTGPDFYADLLERSKEQDEPEKPKEEAQEEKAATPEPEKPSPEKLKA